MDYAQSSAIEATIAYIFRHLPNKPTVDEATEEIMAGFGKLDDWSDDGLRRVCGIVGQLLSGGRNYVAPENLEAAALDLAEQFAREQRHG